MRSGISADYLVNFLVKVFFLFFAIIHCTSTVTNNVIDVNTRSNSSWLLYYMTKVINWFVEQEALYTLPDCSFKFNSRKSGLQTTSFSFLLFLNFFLTQLQIHLYMLPVWMKCNFPYSSTRLHVFQKQISIMFSSRIWQSWQFKIFHSNTKRIKV